jgi:transposase InsO family protein
MSAIPISKELMEAPFHIRFAAWISFGFALRIPVGDFFDAMDLQSRIFKRHFQGRRIRLTLPECLRFRDAFRTMGKKVRSMVDWAVSPDAIIKRIKRHQEQHANADRHRPKTGRPLIAPEKEAFILRVYHAGIHGLSRIAGELAKVGIHYKESTIRNVLNRHGLAPAPTGGRVGTTWPQFLRNFAHQILGIDYIQIPVGLFGWAKNYFILFGIEHDTRKVHILGITDHPTDSWLANVMRSKAEDINRKYWIHDNDGKFQGGWKQILKWMGMKSVPICRRAPNMNAIAERFVKSIRLECLDRIPFLTAQALEHAVREYAIHYNTERPHQGVGNVPLGSWEPTTEGRIVCDQRLGGILKSFRRAA